MGQNDGRRKEGQISGNLRPRHISSLCDSRIHKNARVLNLNDNHIQDLQGVTRYQNLTILYLTNNKIDSMELICHLPHLGKLFLGLNYISRLEGLENCCKLKELFIGSQRIKQPFSFSQTTLRFLVSLTFLDISRNQVTDISPLSAVDQLENLNVSFNELSNLSHTLTVLKEIKSLKVLDCTGNPFVHDRCTRETLLSQLPQLRMLNGQEITPAVINYYLNVNKLHKFKNQKNKKSMDVKYPCFHFRIDPIGEQSTESTAVKENSQHHNWRKLTIKTRRTPVAVDECLRIMAKSLPTGFRSVVSSSKFYKEQLMK